MKKNEKKISRRRLWTIRAGIFLALFILAEVVLRFMGYKPGVAADFYYHSESSMEYDSVLIADEYGITHHAPNGQFITGQYLNEDGFMSAVEHTKEAMDSLRKLGKKVVLLVGDSFTQGCCPDTYQESFAYLLNESDEYEVLNFGVGGTDPLHYELIVKRYVPMLEPDLVTVAVYLGNDQMDYDRTAKPYIPVCYPVKNGPWLSSEATLRLRKPNTHFKTFAAAKEFYCTYYTLWGDENSFFEKVIRHSVILSRVYLSVKFRLELRNQQKLGNNFTREDKPPYTYNHLKEISDFCAQGDTPLLMVAIPTPMEAEENEDIKKKYNHFFNALTWHATTKNFSLDDYDGSGVGNHFNAQGHLKFKKFIQPYVENKLK